MKGEEVVEKEVKNMLNRLETDVGNYTVLQTVQYFRSSESKLASDLAVFRLPQQCPRTLLNF